MGRFWRLLAEYDAETTTFSACAGGAGASPYTPDFNGTLLAIRTMAGSDAATTLIENGEIRLTCSNWKPNVMSVPFNGTGLRTAPAMFTPPIDCPVSQPIQAGVPITIEGRNITADTPVGVVITIWGLFEGGN